MFWIGLTVLGAWFVVMAVALRRAILTQPRDEPLTVERLAADLEAVRQRLDNLAGDRKAP